MVPISVSEPRGAAPDSEIGPTPAVGLVSSKPGFNPNRPGTKATPLSYGAMEAEMQ
jgi:hypothetical protein